MYVRLLILCIVCVYIYTCIHICMVFTRVSCCEVGARCHSQFRERANHSKGILFSRHGVLALKEVPGGLADNVGPPKHTREFGLREALRPE